MSSSGDVIHTQRQPGRGFSGRAVSRGRVACCRPTCAICNVAEVDRTPPGVADRAKNGPRRRQIKAILSPVEYTGL